MRRFNTTGTCYPDEHYMVDITKRLDIIEQKVANGEYITINRGRQYGKTTTLYHLTKRLSKDYVVFSISFESFNQNNFATDDRLAFSLVNLMKNQIKIRKNINDYVRDAITTIIDKNSEKKEISVDSFSEFIENICSDSDKPIVLIIDEVDNASNYESFINLLRFLRDKYLNRRHLPTFKSVILAGVYDIKNLKLKVRPESEHQYNSPWNIAVPFDEDMSLSKSGIEKMLAEYEADHKTGMDIPQMAQLITDYTSGYPFFVSRLCQLIDTHKLEWNREGFLKAENMWWICISKAV